MDLTSILFSIISIFFTPFISILIDNKINQITPKITYSAFIKYAVYTVFVFLFSKTALFVLQIATGNEYGTNSLQFLFLAILFSLLLPLIVNLFLKRFDIDITIKGNEKK